MTATKSKTFLNVCRSYGCFQLVRVRHRRHHDNPTVRYYHTLTNDAAKQVTVATKHFLDTHQSPVLLVHS